MAAAAVIPFWLCTLLLASGCNLLLRIATPTSLQSFCQAFACIGGLQTAIRSIKSAVASIVNRHYRHPLARLRGGGTICCATGSAASLIRPTKCKRHMPAKVLPSEIHTDASDVALLRVRSQFFRHVADGEVDEGAHARR